MKTKILSVALFLIATSLFANDARYLEVMSKNIESLYTAKTIEELQASVNTIERIASSERTKWEPHYYVSFGYVMMANREADPVKKDAFLDLAMAALGSAKRLNESESEILALEGFVYMIRVTVDPASRGQQYSGLSFQSFEKALALNPENPRAMGLLAQMKYGTAQFFKASTEEACLTAGTALKKFDTYKSENPLAPRWGRKMVEGLLTYCK